MRIVSPWGCIYFQYMLVLWCYLRVNGLILCCFNVLILMILKTKLKFYCSLSSVRSIQAFFFALGLRMINRSRAMWSLWVASLCCPCFYKEFSLRSLWLFIFKQINNLVNVDFGLPIAFEVFLLVYIISGAWTTVNLATDSVVCYSLRM